MNNNDNKSLTIPSCVSSVGHDKCGDVLFRLKITFSDEIWHNKAQQPAHDSNKASILPRSYYHEAEVEQQTSC